MNTTTMTMTNICKIIRREGSATVEIKGEQIVIGFADAGHQGELTMLGGGFYTIRTQDGRRFPVGKGELVTVVTAA